MTSTSIAILAPVGGTVLALAEVPDPVFARGMVGPGAAIEPPHEVVEVVAPVTGTLLKVYPHAFVVLTPSGKRVLVHLGIDTVEREGAGFTLHRAQGDAVDAGTRIVTYDVPAIVAAGLEPVVPVVVVEARPEDVTLDGGVPGARIAAGAPFLALVR